MSDTNPNCDGSHCTHHGGEVRLYPLGTGPLHGNLILCRACFAHENAYNRARGRETGAPENFPEHAWDTAKHCPEPVYTCPWCGEERDTEGCTRPECNQ